MVCPYCQKEMEKGSLVGGHWYLHYVPDGEQLPLSIFSKNPKGVKFKVTILNGLGYTDAFRCNECKKIIVDYPENKKS